MIFWLIIFTHNTVTYVVPWPVVFFLSCAPTITFKAINVFTLSWRIWFGNLDLGNEILKENFNSILFYQYCWPCLHHVPIIFKNRFSCLSKNEVLRSSLFSLFVSEMQCGKISPVLQIDNIRNFPLCSTQTIVICFRLFI